MTNYDRYLAKQMQDWRFRFWYTVRWPWYQMARLRMWLWRVTHRREARRFDEYMRQIYQWSDEYDREVLVTSVEKAEDPTYPPDGADSERVAERLDRYVGER